MSKIISLEKQTPNNPTSFLDAFSASLKAEISVLDDILEVSKNCGEQAAEIAGLNFNNFLLTEASASVFVNALANHQIMPLVYDFTDKSGVCYELEISVFFDNEESASADVSLCKEEKGVTYAFNFKGKEWMKYDDGDEDDEYEIAPELEDIINSATPEGDIVEEIVNCENITWEDYLHIKESNKAYFDLCDRVYNFMIPFVDVVYDGDDHEFEFSLEPKDPCCFGFKVVYHNGSFLLLQNIESVDISCVQGMEYIEDDEELYDREPFTVEVGSTEDIDKISDILRELGDHYLEEDVAMIPLSLSSYMKVTSFNPVVYEVCYMDKERKQRTVEEEKLRKEAVQELLVYRG